MSAPMVKWISTELSKLLGFDTTDIANYILTIESAKDVEEYVCELLDGKQTRNRKFIDELLRKWRPPRQTQIPQNVQLYQKAPEEQEYITGVQGSKTKKKGKKQADAERDASPVPPDNPAVNGFTKKVSPPRKQGQPVTTSLSPGDGKKKTKFVPLFNEDGDSRTAAIIPGRHMCDCQSAKHGLINNCMNCGRIVCEQEGSGPCLFCGALVCTAEQQEVLNRGSKKSEKLRQLLLSQGGADENRVLLPNASTKMKEGFEKALMHKDRLLEYDKTAVKRTQVIDDESDYFATDSKWLSKEERQLLRQREDQLRSVRHASRKDRKVTLDFAGRRVVEENQPVDVYDINDTVVQAVHYGKKKADRRKEEPAFTDDDFGGLVNPLIKQEAPQFIDTMKSTKKPLSKPSDSGGHLKVNRIQDRELLEMSDDGVCMSMHQPWASMLVKGIKRHEGRSWYSAHRGRLWIAATSKRPLPEEIRGLENQYCQLYKTSDLPFPADYPAACILGCVDVVDVLEQDAYRQKYPAGESDSPYVFVCENPQELIVKFPMKGKHKIYKLDHHIHQGAKKGLRPS